jgi:hypothetical protein
MFSKQICFTLALVGLISAAPVEQKKQKRDSNAHVNAPAGIYTINNQDGVGAGSSNYNFYSGDGTPGAGWPSQSQWASFEDM